MHVFTASRQLSSPALPQFLAYTSFFNAMRLRLVFLFAVLCFAGVSAQAAADTENLLNAFLKTAREEVAKIPTDARGTFAGPSLRSPTQLSATIDNLERVRRPLKLADAQYGISTIRAALFSSKNIRETSDALLDALTADDAAQVAQANSDAAAILLQAAQACLSAATPEDLDESLKTLTLFTRSQEAVNHSPDSSTARSRVVLMTTFVAGWQDYLRAKNINDSDAMWQAVERLKQSVDPSLIPRSRLLALPTRATGPVKRIKGAVETIPEILERLEKFTTLDELDLIVTDMGSLALATPERSEFRTIWALAKGYVADRQVLSQGKVSFGLFTARDRRTLPIENSLCTGPMIAAFQRISLQLQRETLASVFKESGLTQHADESTDAFVFRVAETAAKAQNWEYALRTVEFYRLIFPWNVAPTWTVRELLSCSTYVAARRLDDAGQIPQAIVAYREALGATGRLTPTALITARLADIKSKHPEAFETADRLPRVNYLPATSAPESLRGPTNSDSRKVYLVPKTDKPLAKDPAD